MRDLLDDFERLQAGGERIGRAVVTSVWGSAPRGPGACMLATPSAKIAGSVSGGCVEGATAVAIAGAIESERSKLIEFGVSDEDAWEVGLACGGQIRILVEPIVRPELLEAARGPAGFGVATATEGPLLGTSLLVYEDGSTTGPLAPPGTDPKAATHAIDTLRTATSELRRGVLDSLPKERSYSATVPVEGDDVTIFFELHPQQPKLVVFGGVHVAAHLVTFAKPLGFRTIVADGREAFLSKDRFPHADELVHAWPEEAFRQIGLDASTYVCVLTHDPKFDDPALQIALRSPARYVGAIGSRKNQAQRRERLKQAGVSDDAVARLRGPIGLDLGGREPAETALAILAEITAARCGGTALSMTTRPPDKT